MQSKYFSKVLFLSNLGVDIGDPSFRFGAYEKYLIPMACSLSKSNVDVKLLANDYIAGKLRQTIGQSVLDQSQLCSISQSEMHQVSLNDFMVASYTKPLTHEQLISLKGLFNECLGYWSPEIIICWETPTNALRALYKESVILDVMPSMFMRPPFPRLLSFDPVGLYKDCWYRETDTRNMPKQDSCALDMVHAIRKYYTEHFTSLGCQQAVEKLKSNFGEAPSTLIPLQISDYFGWRDTSHYKDQFQFLESALKSAGRETPTFVTQYISGLTQEKCINDGNLDYLCETYNNLIYDVSFEKADNISQYLLPTTDNVITVSSTLGLQAKFFEKTLISPSSSHLSYLADSTNLQDQGSVENLNLDQFFASYLGRTCYLQKRLFEEDNYLYSLLNEFYARRHHTGLEKFPNYGTVENTLGHFTENSALKSSRRLFQKAFPDATTNIKELDYIDSLADASCISFDVFDTLVCRTVISPLDVFKLMAQHLRITMHTELDRHFIDNFAQWRKNAETEMRGELDAKADPSLDEMTIHNVYHLMLTQHNQNLSYCDQLVQLEQEIELSCLQQRKTGHLLYENAIKLGKKIIIISDFIHPASFVERVLKQCGIQRWDALYVSSDIGLKKHNGALFKYVLADQNLEPSSVLHIGDNLIGDIKMAKKHAIKTLHIAAPNVLVKNCLIDRKFNLQASDKSVMTGALLSLYANTFLDNYEAAIQRKSEQPLIASKEAFGFLILGPLMHFFAQWVYTQAKDINCRQIIFFARDCYLPYKMLKAQLLSQTAQDIKVCYLPISRVGASGLDIFEPTDLRRIHIQDFDKNKKLLELFTIRFSLIPSEISSTALLKWKLGSLNSLKVKDASIAAIYDIAIASAQENWNEISKRLQQKRDTINALFLQLDIDLNMPSMGVDFGYKGTINRKLSPLFSNGLTPRFFMSYANELGNDPLENLDVFHARNLNPNLKHQSIFLSHNLLIETLLNEGTGSVVGYSYDAKRGVKVLRDGILNTTHKNTIAAIHNGALTFSKEWLLKGNILDAHTEWEPHMRGELLSFIMKHPNSIEAKMLAPLQFENAYSNKKPNNFVSITKSGTITGSGLWHEGINTLNNTPLVSKVNLGFIAKLYTPIVRHFVTKLGNENDVRLFNQDPSVFFKNLSDPQYRKVGEILYPRK